MKPRAFLCASAFVLGGALPALSQEPRFIEDSGHIVVIEHDGESYDRDTTDGELNAAPRQRIAAELIETHGDFYDFIVVFTNFDFDRNGAIGFYTNVRNDVDGIHLPVVDNGDSFGSPARLQGFIDMGPIGQYRAEPFSLEPGDPDFRTTLGVLAHEIGHRWLAGARFDSGDGPRDDLLGLDGVHWSFLLSSDASFLYGNAWELLSGDVYRSAEIQSRFSELDLYLMGLLAPEDVSPMTLLVNPDVDRARLPELGAEIEAVDVETVTIDQVIAAEGARSPSHQQSQKDFNVAFVFLTQESLLPTPRDLEAVERVRSSFMESFFGLTRGRAFADPDLLTVAPVTPGAIPNTALAIEWLVAQQLPDGRYEAHPLTAIRDTSKAAVALSTLGIRGAPVDDARAWLTARSPSSVDFVARALAAGAALPAGRLDSLRNPDGGFGLAPGYRSDPLDTALALIALADSPAALEIAEALASMQLGDGSWSSIAGQPGDVMTTSEAALALALSGQYRAAVQDALAWLVTRQQLDGGFGDGPSAPYATARALQAFLNGTVPRRAIDGAIAYLETTQSGDGSWRESVFETAAVLEALVPATVTNLSLDAGDIFLAPDPPEVGETVSVEVTVRNRSLVPAPRFDVQLFVGDPEEGGLAVGAPELIDGLGGGATRVVTFQWDTSGLEGPHTLFAIADFAGVVSEISKEDNVVLRDVEVLPPLPNLVVSQLDAEPASPIVGAATTLTARVENTGSAAAGATRVRFYREVPGLGIELGDALVSSLPPGGAEDVTIVWDTTGQEGAHTVHAVVDPDGADVRERIESDNQASLAIDVRPPPPVAPDLEIHGFTLMPSELERLPLSITARARIVNTGLDPVPSARVELFRGHPDLGGVLVSETSTPVPGDGGVDVALGFEVTTGGSRTYYLRVDASPTPERDLTNNLASAELRDSMDVVDVALEPGSVVLSSSSIDPGDTLSVDVSVANTGTRTLSSVAVALFYEIAPGAFRLASTLSVPLAPGASETVRLTWTANRTGTVPLELRVDPDDVLAEAREDDNTLTTSVDVTASPLPNLSLAASDITASPPALAEGSAATLEALVRNLGEGAAGAFTVDFFAGDPDRGGRAIGTAAVSELAARSTTVVTLEWDPIRARGEIPVFVVVDAGATVDELDELDNRVFRLFDIEGLPDLFTTAAEIRLTPPFARSGDSVTVDASFTNVGEQPAAPMAVEIRLDDPTGGALIASEEIGELAPGASGSVTALWDTAGVEGEHALYLVLDVRDDVVEQREDNNIVRVPVALQDADVFVAPVFFSPNGDGVRDEAAFFYRVSTAGELRAEVRDVEERVVRRFDTVLGLSASVVWDGRDDDGVLAFDGTYAFVLLDDGAEVVRRRVVLDTNRSRIVEALGTDLVSFTQLTCPLPGALAPPAWLPNDRAAYVIVAAPNVDEAPDYPVGLYRVTSDAQSLELVLADDGFAGIKFVDRILDQRGQRLRAVSLDGARALVRSDAEGLALLDPSTGERTPLGHDARASAMWTPTGDVLVGSSTGLFFYDARGNLLDTVSTADVYVALLAPDGQRIVYRRRDEIVLRVINVDGSGDRILESTDASLFFEQTPAPDQLDLDELYYLEPDTGPVVEWFFQNIEDSSGVFRVDLDEDTVSEADRAGPLSSDGAWETTPAGSFYVARRRGGRETRPIIPSSLGGLPTWSYRDTHLGYFGPSGDGCAGGVGYWAVRSLLNGEADFRLTRLPSRFGVQITGTVADQNLDSYALEYASVEAPEAFAPIQPLSNVPVIADTITTWIPPGPGDYLVRLTLEDKAGNETVRLDRIFWEETLPIASLRRAPVYLSPNGDSVHDELLVEYDVLATANLEFHVRDGDGRIVRTIERNEFTLGPASFTWDGTNDFGAPVDDGNYVLEIEGAAFPVIVDRTAPLVEAEYSELYTDDRDDPNVKLAVDLEGRIRDASLDAWELADADGEILVASRREVGTDSEPAILLERIAPVQGLEIRARDRAGNETAVPLAGPSREVRIIRARTNPIGPFQPGPASAVGTQTVHPRFGISLIAEKSFAAELRFVYGPVDDEATVTVETPRSVGISADDLVLGTTYVGHFEADGLRSQDVQLVAGPGAIILSPGPPRFLGHEIFMTNTVAEPLVEGRWMDQRGRVLRVYRPVPEHDSIVVATPPCGLTDSYFIEATGESGTRYQSTTNKNYPIESGFPVAGNDCLTVEDVGIAGQASPEAAVPTEARAFINNERKFDAAPETLLLILDDGVDAVEVGRAPGGHLADRIVSFDIGPFAEGDYTLSARAIVPGVGEVEGDDTLRFFLDQSPPETTIVSPAEGENACIATVDTQDVLALDVLVRDRMIQRLGVELMLPDGGWLPLSLLETPALPVFTQFAGALQAVVPDGLSGEITIRLVATNERVVGESFGSSRTSTIWPEPRNNGGLYGSASRTVFVAPPLGLGPAIAGAPLFSPNEDTVADEVTVRSEALEAASLTARVFTPSPGRVLVRTIVSEQAIGVGPVEIVWDGRDDDGLVVADGEYEVELEAVNGCGGSSTATTTVEVDTTAPDVAIENLVDDQPISVGVEIVGTASEQRHFDHYVLEVGEGDAPLMFVEIAPPVRRRVVSDVLGNWSVGGLDPGVYTVRLSASDTVGNRASTRVRVEVLAGDFINAHEAEPPLFSPNADDVQDETLVQFELEAEARVTLSIVDGGDAVVATLVDAVVLGAGAHAFVWDGLGVPDGDYAAFLHAEHPLVTTLFEESRISLAVDTAAPEIVIGSPVADGFVSLPSNVSGSITDDYLERFVVEVGPTLGALTTIAEDSLPVTGILAPLRGLGDGSYRFRATATDRAGNASELGFTFDVDSTKPVLALTAPARDAFVNGTPDRIPVIGSVDESHLERYDLELGFGVAPVVFVPLAGGTTLPVEATLATWELESLPDGPYTLRLSASDLASNFAVVETRVTLDTTSPTVTVTFPEPEAVLAEPFTVRGTVADTNFSTGELRVAPASRPDQLTPIASFPAPIVDGALAETLALADGDYILELHAEDRAGNVANVTHAVTVDTDPPLPPSDLTASAEGTSALVAWTASASTDVIGYHVRRDGTRITDIPAPGTSFVDPDLLEGRYRYTVVAVDRGGLESEPTAPATVVIDLTPPTTILRAPDDGARVRVEVEIVGTAFAESDFLEYRIDVAPAATPLARTNLKQSSVPVSFDTLARWQPLEDGDYILTLEAEDTSGNVAGDSVRVTVDNAPPEAPVLVRAEPLAKPDDVEIEWSAPDDTDVDGFLVLRNGKVANAPGNVSGSLRPFLVPGPVYVDADLPDGEHCYRVAAMDLAGNISADSNELCVVLDNREPVAIVVDPEDGARFDASRFVTAASDDLDIATVSFEYQADGDTFWTVIAVDADGRPFEAFWDISGIDFGAYRLRAVATDIGTRSDPAPATIGIVLGDVTPPPAPEGFTARTVGDRVELSWSAVDALDLAGYRIFRDEALVLEPGAGEVAAAETGVPDGGYEYTIRAVDVDGNVSEASEAAPARVYAPLLLPAFPVVETLEIDLPGANAEPGASVRLFVAGTTDELASTTADASGAFAFTGLALPPGAHVLEAEATDVDGNVSRRSPEALVIRNDVPAAPDGFAAVADGDDANLSWNANGELDLSGYLVGRDGELANTRGLLRPTGPIPTGHEARASVNDHLAPRVLGGFSGWSMSAGEEAWIEVELDQPRHLDEVRLDWIATRSAKDYDVLVELEGRLAPVVRARDRAPESFTVHELPIPLQTTRVRVHIFSSATGFAIILDELELIGILPETTTSFTDRPGTPGRYDYTVRALDVLGGASADAGPIHLGVGDLTAPEPPTMLEALVDEADVLLTWSPSPSPDVTRYRVYRDGVPIRDVTNLFVTDAGLRNGSYRYFVTALDAADNESAPSSPADAVVDVLPPSPPALAVSPVLTGRALTLSWTESVGPLGVASYVVARSSTSGGPYEDIASVNGATFALTDDGLEDGIEQFYVVRAVDFRGEASEPSNEASGVPNDTVAPPAPVWIAPDSPQLVTRSRVKLVGAAEPASIVHVERSGEPLGDASVSDTFEPIAAPFVRSTTNVAGRFAISPDGQRVAEMATNFSPGEAYLYDLRTGAVTVVPYDEGGSFERSAAFSPDGSRIAVSTTIGTPRFAVRILDLESELTEVIELADVPNTLAWVSDTELAVVLAEADIRILDLEADVETTIYTSSGVEPAGLVASPDGAYLAWREQTALYVMSRHGGVPELVADRPGLEAFVWAGPRTLVVDEDGVGIHFYDIDSRLTTLVDGTERLDTPRSLGVPGVVSAFDGAELVWVFADGSIVELGEPPSRFDLGFVEWTAELALAGVTSGFELSVLGTPGRFELDARLVSGLNRITARAEDAASNVSADSDPLELTYDTSALADLTVDRDLVVIPSTPVTGDQASLSIAVLNRGESASDGSSVTVTGLDPLGSLYSIGAAPLPPLASGGRTTVSVSWPTAGRLGPQRIRAMVDPLELLDEADETNNDKTADVVVVGAEGLELAIAVGRERYAAGQTAELTVSAVNGGAAGEFVLETFIENELGELVASVDARPASLGYAQSAFYQTYWSVGAVTAGSYVARVNALLGDDVVATAAAPFELTRTLTLTLDVISDRPAYEQGDAVTLFARVANENSNTPLRDLSLRYRIVDPRSTTVFETTRSVGYLAIGGTTSSSAVWVSGADEPGEYAVSVEALEGVEVLAARETRFELRPGSSVRLSGALELGAGAVPAGADVVVTYTVDNDGVVALADGTVRVELYDPELSRSLVHADSPLSVDGGESVTGELRIDTSGLELGDYVVVLLAGATPLESLATTPVTLFATPAAPSLNAPADGASARQRLLLSVNNATNPNQQTLTYDFEIYLDRGLTISIGTASAIPEGSTTTSWSVQTFLQENRRYYWRARAKDRFAVSDWMAPAEVFVDSVNEAPEAPVLSAPPESSAVDVLRPTLVVGNAVDPEGDALTYRFELYRDPGLTDRVLDASDVVETDATTSFTVTVDLDEDATYYWRARANDGELDGEWMPASSFRVDTANHAPTAPVPLAPLGPEVTTLAPELVVDPGRDPEREPVLHAFEIDTTDRFDSSDRQASPPLADVRWSPPVALVENAVYFWRARASDGVATGPWSATVTFRVNVANEPPEAPTPQRPNDGAVVESATPVLAVVNASDPENDALTYSFDVYDDPGLTSRVATVSSLPEGDTETAWSVSPRLEEETTYFWVAFASDGRADGPSSPVQSFRVNVMNEEPSAPVPLAPPEGGIVSDVAPTLVVANASDPDGDPLTYRFEVYANEMLTPPDLESSGEIGEGVGQTSWTMSEPLEENRLYYWRVRAFDGRLAGAWTATARFRFSLANEPPTPPVLVAPGDGAIVAEPRPTLTIAASSDPEDDNVLYTYEVYRDAALTELVTRSPETEETAWLVDVDLDENETFYWRAIASDGDLATPSSESFRFTVNVLDEPPTMPVLLTPADGAIVTTTAPVLVVENATSPDGAVGEPLSYHFVLYADAALTDIVAEEAAVPEAPGQTSWDPMVSLAPGATYYWRARAVDRRGLVSAWATAFSFIVEPPGDDCPPEWHDDFERYPHFSTPVGWRLDRELGHPAFQVRRHAGSKRLESAITGRGSLLFAGSGEAFSWRNYELEGEILQRRLAPSASPKPHQKLDCAFTTGVAFYARPSEATAYRLELTGPSCHRPQARLVKMAQENFRELARIDLDSGLDRGHAHHPLAFHIEAVNHPGGTSLRVRLTGRVRERHHQWVLEVEDTVAPLRSGTVGAWGSFVAASWDDFHVRAIDGLESGISGDADDDGVCDVDFDSGSCGAELHWIHDQTNRLVVRNPEPETARYRLRLIAFHHGTIRLHLPDGSKVELRTWFGLSHPVELELPPGEHEIRLTPKVYVKGFRWERICR